MKIAVEGCAHGELDNIYGTIQTLERENNCKVDLLICCGDFQSTRNLQDLKCMAVPEKHRDICTFYKYYSGEKVAPVLTIFIGGNHEASNYLQELAYGGWVAPRIYYLGYAGVIKVGNVRIGGLSGIFKGRDYCKGRYEKPPYNGDSLRSCYHIRNLDVFRLKQLSQKVDIMLSHDWPNGIHSYGNVKQLLKHKPYLSDDIANNSLGSKPATEVLETLKPDYWFSAHLHTKFAAIVHHKGEDDQKTTKFLALDKCLPKRKFLQLVEIPHDTEEGVEISYDLEWLSILRNTNHLLSVKKVNMYLPGPGGEERHIFTPTEEEMELVRSRFNGDMKIPDNFVQTAPAYDPNTTNSPCGNVQAQLNPQTTVFCEQLGVDDPMNLLLYDNGFSPCSSLNSSLNSSSLVASDSSFLSPQSPARGCRTPLQLPQPMRTTLKLPEPANLASTPLKNSEEDVDEIGLSPVPNKLNTTSESDSSVLSQDLNVTEPGIKRFRRRNLNLYQNNDNE